MDNIQDLFGKMKDYVSKVGKSASELSKTAVDKVETKAKEAKIRYAMQKTEERIKSNYATIGKLVYEDKLLTDTHRFSSEFARIDALLEEKQEFNNRLREECGKTICPDCDSIVGKDDVHCPVCGAKIRYE